MVEIVIPSVGIGMEEALFVKWLKEPGDEVAAEEPVAEIETDKATMELVSPIGGTLGAHLLEPGAVVPVGTVVAHVVSADVEGDVVPRAVESVEAAVESRVEKPIREQSPTVEGERRPHALSPRARRLAKERTDEVPRAPAGDGRFRELVAAKVTESWREIPHFAVSREVDAEPMLAALEQIRASAGEPRPTFTDLLLRALALGLRDASGDAGAGDVGLAVATPHGVVISVVREVLGQDAAGLARARSAAVERARAGRLSSDDLSASPASTLSNLGSFGVDSFTGIIAGGQTSLLTVGRAVPRVFASVDRTLGVRTTFHATLNADHRTIDGAEAARLLVAFARAAESMTPDF